MRFSISQLMIAILAIALAIGIGYPSLRFLLYENVNFSYDRDQTIEYIQSATSGKLKMQLLDAVTQLSVWDDDGFIIVDAKLSNNSIHVELISNTLHPPEWLNIKLDSGKSIDVHSNEIKTTGTYYFHGDITIDDRIKGSATIESIQLRRGNSQCNRFTFADSQHGG